MTATLIFDCQQAQARRNNNAGQSEASSDQSEAEELTLDVEDVSVLTADVRVLGVGGPEESDHYQYHYHEEVITIVKLKSNV